MRLEREEKQHEKSILIILTLCLCLLCACGTGQADGAKAEDGEGLGGALDNIPDIPGTDVLPGWDQEAFGILPEPENFEYSMMSITRMRQLRCSAVPSRRRAIGRI